MPVKLLTSKIFIAILAAVFVAGGGYSVWRHQKATEKPIAEIKIEEKAVSKLAKTEQPAKKAEKKVATSAPKPIASVVNIIAPKEKTPTSAT